MIYSELAYRYATAIFDLAKEANKSDLVLAEIRAFSAAVEKDASAQEFMNSPLVPAAEKEAAFRKTLDAQKMSDEARNFLLLLARKDRLGLVGQISHALEAKQDEMNQVTRGTVRSAAELSSQQRAELEKHISKVTGKKVILSYEVDGTVVGGLTAQVGSLTFDDTLASHLKHMQDDLNRRVH